MKLKIYHGIKERTIIEIPDDINAVAIDDRDIIFIDDTDHKRVYNVVFQETKDITLRLQQGLPSTVCQRRYAKLNTNHMRISINKDRTETEDGQNED